MPLLTTRRLFIVLTAGLAAALAWQVFGLRVAETRALFPAGELVPSLELARDRELLQTFVARSDGLRGITLYPQPVTHPTAGRVELVLERGPQTPVARAVFPIGDIRGQAAWTWWFPPIPDSAGEHFWLRIRLPHTAAGTGLSFGIGPPTFPGRLYVWGRAQWGTLSFQTQSDRARFIDLLQGRRPARTAGAIAVAAILVLGAASAAVAAMVTGLALDRDVAS